MGEQVWREVGFYGSVEAGWGPRRRVFCRWCIWLCQGGGRVATIDFDGRAVDTLGLLWLSSAEMVHCDGEAQAVVQLCNCC